MALKKPSELLNTKKESSESFLDKPVQKFVEQPELNSFSEVFDSFKNNLSNIEVLSGKVEEIQEEVKSLLKKEDLERAMVSQLLVLEQSIRDIQSKVKGINESNLESIKEDIATLSSSVNDFIEVEVPKYEKRTVESEFRIGKNFSQLESNVNKSLDVVNESLDVINEFVENKYQELAESLEGINEQSLSGIVEDFKNLENIINEFKTNDIPKYKDFIVTSEKRSETLVDEKLDQFDSKVQDNIDSIDAKVVSEVSALNDKFLELKEEDIPSYKKFIIDTEKRTESKLKEFSEDFDSKVEQSNKSISERYKKFIAETEIKNDINLKEFREKLDNTTSSILEKVSLIDRDHTDLVDIVTGKVSEVNDLVSSVNLSEEKFKKSIEEKISNLELEVIRYESHLKTQNKNLERVQEDIKLSLTGLSDLVEECDKNNYDLGKKIKYLEEVFTKFDEKELLTEGLLDSPSETNSDPLTPLDQNFVTLDQLQNHYRVFINRIQQQLSTLGGGGETRLEFLDDVDRDTAKVNGKFLKYDSSSGKWVGANASGGAGSQTLDETLGLGNTSSLGMSVGVATATKIHVDPVGSGFTYSEDLVVQGNARVTGILSIGTSSIVLDANNSELRGVQQIRLHSADANAKPVIIKQVTEKIVFIKTEDVNGEEVETEEEVSVGIGTTVSINTSGIITASSFVGNLTGIATGATRVYVDESEDDNTDYNIIFTDKDPGPGNSHHTMQVDNTGLTFNPATNTLKVSHLESAVAVLEVNDQLRITDTLRVRADNKEFIVENGSGNNKFTVDTDNGNTQVMGDLQVDGNVTGNLTGNVTGTATTATNLNNQAASYYLDYDNFTNTPTIPTNNNQLTNGAGYITTSFTNTNQLTNGAGFITSSDDISGTSGGLTGSPSITVTDITAVGNVSITGTLTYEDVTNVDSIGIATARTGLNVLSGGINVTGVSTFNDQVHLPDNTKIMLGASNDLQIIHIPGTGNSIQGTSPIYLQTTSEIHLREYGGSQVFAKFIKNGAVELNHNGDKRLETTASGIDITGHTETDTLRVSGVSTFQNNVHLLDDDRLQIGGSSGTVDGLEIYHDGSNSYINDTGTGALQVRTSALILRSNVGENMAFAYSNGAVQLYHNNSRKFETTTTGIDVTGLTDTDTLNVSSTSTFVGDANFDNATLYVDSTNNRLGVGLNNPAVPLHMFGSYPTLKIENSNTNQYASASIDLQGPAGDERSTKILHGNSNAGGTETYFQIEQHNSSGSYVKTLAQYNYQYDYWSFLTGGTERLKLDYSGITVTGDVTVTAIATAPTFYAESGTYAAGTDTVTDAAIVIEEEGSIYTKDGAYLRKLIEKKSDIINIGQQNTSLVDGIHLKPGTTGGSVKLHAGGSTDNVKLETTASGITVTGDVEITPTNSGGEGGHITLRNPDKTSTGAEIDVSSANTFRIFQLNNNSTMEMGQLSGTGGTILFKTENTERMKIHANGCITKPSHPILKVNSTHTFGAYQSLHANPNVSIAQASAQIDIGDNGWTTSGSNAYTFVCPVTGVYAVHAHISLGDITQGNRVIWSMAYTFGGGNLPLQNYVEVIDTTVSDYQNASYFDTWYFSAGTRVGMGINTNSGGTITNHGLSWGMYLLQ